VKCAQLVVIAPDHKIVYVSNGASEIVAKVGGLPGMPYHLRRLGSSLELRKAELMKAWAQKKLKQPRYLHQEFSSSTASVSRKSVSATCWRLMIV